MMEIVGFDDPWTREPGWAPQDAKQYALDLAAQVESRLRAHTTEYWVKLFSEAGIPAGPMRLRDELADDEQAWANGFLVRIEHEVAGGNTVVAPPVKFSGSPLRVGSPSPGLGQHSREVLLEAGLDVATVEDLVERRVVRIEA
jgi:crotonobetainyl-CoA:carnitine CoA-transferase CaiB-like acyl-CoA transferase